MPLWVIHHPSNAFNDDQKQQISKEVTDLYSGRFGMPKFYAVVIFSPSDNIFIGGQQSSNFVRIVISHLARESNRDPGAAEVTKSAFNRILKPFVESRGMDWEVSYSDSPRLFWQINGMDPPPTGSDQEQLWVKENKAVPF